MFSEIMTGSIITLTSLIFGTMIWAVLNEMLDVMEPWLRVLEAAKPCT